MLLSCTETDLQEKLGMNFSAARKVTKRLNEAKAIAASQQLATENIAPVPDKTTPLIEASQPAPEAVELTAGPTVPQKRGRGRPPKNNRQPRLSQRLNAQDLVSEDEEPDQAEEEERELGRNTRQRVTRLAGVKRAEETMHEQDEPIQEADPEAFEPSEDETESEEEEEALPARRRGRPARRQPAARAAPAADAMEEDTQDNRPEEPDDGVHPSNGAIWEDAVRVGLEDILKLMPIAKVREGPVIYSFLSYM